MKSPKHLRNVFDLFSTSLTLNDQRAVDFLFINEVKNIFKFEGILASNYTENDCSIRAISGVADVNKTSFLVQKYEDIISAIKNSEELESKNLSLQGLFEDDANLSDPSATNIFVLPTKLLQERTGSALSILSTTPISDVDQLLLNRIVDMYAYNLDYIAKTSFSKNHRGSLGKTKKTITVGLPVAALVIGLLLIKTPVSVTAPVEIIPKNPAVITASQNGVIKQIYVEENADVKKGQELFDLDTTELEGELSAADNAIQIADEKIHQLRQKSLVDTKAAHDLRLFEIERSMKLIEVSFAQNKIKRAKSVSPVSGQVIMGRREDFIGRPVQLGEKILKIADETKIEAEILINSKDVLDFTTGDEVELFLDSHPTASFHAELEYISYEASQNEDGSYTHVAKAKIFTEQLPRIGSRGVAKVKGDSRPIAFLIFRRPLIFMRQLLGL